MNKTREKTWEQRLAERENADRTYFTLDLFLADMRAQKLKENFLMDEVVFKDFSASVNGDAKLAQEVADCALLILMRADSGFEINGIIEIAHVVAEEADG